MSIRLFARALEPQIVLFLRALEVQTVLILRAMVQPQCATSASSSKKDRPMPTER